jgi:hypothetical protein
VNPSTIEETGKKLGRDLVSRSPLCLSFVFLFKPLPVSCHGSRRGHRYRRRSGNQNASAVIPLACTPEFETAPFLGQSR